MNNYEVKRLREFLTDNQNPDLKTQSQLIQSRFEQKCEDVKNYKGTVKGIRDFDHKIEDRENSL